MFENLALSLHSLQSHETLGAANGIVYLTNASHSEIFIKILFVKVGTISRFMDDWWYQGVIVKRRMRRLYLSGL